MFLTMTISGLRFIFVHGLSGWGSYDAAYRRMPYWGMRGGDLMAFLGLIPGAVTPLGLLNDGEKRVQFFVDREFLQGEAMIGVHPNDNTATVWLKTADLLRILEEHGTKVHPFDL